MCTTRRKATWIASAIGQLKAVTAHFTLIALSQFESTCSFHSNYKLQFACADVSSGCEWPAQWTCYLGMVSEPTQPHRNNDADNLAMIQTLHKKYTLFSFRFTVCAKNDCVEWDMWFMAIIRRLKIGSTIDRFLTAKSKSNSCISYAFATCRPMRQRYKSDCIASHLECFLVFKVIS